MTDEHLHDKETEREIDPGLDHGDIGLEELATEERLKEESEEAREMRRQPSDLQSPGDPNAGDVGIPGGIAVGDADSIDHENAEIKKEKEEESL